MAGADSAVLIACVALASIGLLWAGLSDLGRYVIPNSACAMVVLPFLIAGAVLPFTTWLIGLLAGFAVLAGGAALFAARRIGGGDAKLAAAAALWSGPVHLTDLALVTSVAGIALAAVMLSPLRSLMPSAPQSPTAVVHPSPDSMPFGAPIAVGGLWMLALKLVAPL